MSSTYYGTYFSRLVKVCSPSLTADGARTFFASSLPDSGWTQSDTFPYKGDPTRSCGDPSAAFVVAIVLCLTRRGQRRRVIRVLFAATWHFAIEHAALLRLVYDSLASASFTFLALPIRRQSRQFQQHPLRANRWRYMRLVRVHECGAMRMTYDIDTDDIVELL